MLTDSLKTLIIVVAVSIFIVMGFQSVVIAGGDAAAGKAIYDGVCAACHGADGNAMIPGVPSFAKGERLDKDDATLAKSIKDGIMAPKNPAAPPMPPYGGGAPLDDKQLADVIAYIRSLAK